MRGCTVVTMLILAAVLGVGACPDPACSQNSAGVQNPAAGAPSSDGLLYKPPMRGAPAGGGRIAAAVRGVEGDSPTLLVLAPDHVGVTSEKSPVLYWYISKPAAGRIEFTLNDEGKGQTVIKAELPPPKQGGIQAIRLSDFNAELAPDVVYEWFVTLEADVNQPAKDVYNGGSIMFQEPPADLQKRLSDAGAAGAPVLYAGAGFWYDAFSATWKTGKGINEKSALRQRISLLEQVGFGASAPGKVKPVLDAEEELLRFLGK